MSSERYATPPAIVPCTVLKITSVSSSIRSHSKSADCGVYDIWTLGVYRYQATCHHKGDLQHNMTLVRCYRPTNGPTRVSVVTLDDMH